MGVRLLAYSPLAMGRLTGSIISIILSVCMIRFISSISRFIAIIVLLFILISIIIIISSSSSSSTITTCIIITIIITNISCISCCIVSIIRKYSAGSEPDGKRFFSALPMEKVDPLVAEMRKVGERNSERDKCGQH